MRAFNHFSSGERGFSVLSTIFGWHLPQWTFEAAGWWGRKGKKTKDHFHRINSGQEENFSKYVMQSFSNANTTRAKDRLHDR